MQYFPPSPLKTIKKIHFVSSSIRTCPFSSFYCCFSSILHPCPPFIVYALYIDKYVCMCRLIKTSNNIKDYKTLNFQSSSNMNKHSLKLNLGKTMSHGKQKYHGITNTKDYLNYTWDKEQIKHNLKT